MSYNLSIERDDAKKDKDKAAKQKKKEAKKQELMAARAGEVPKEDKK